jgi:hypothetical protein
MWTLPFFFLPGLTSINSQGVEIKHTAGCGAC